MNKKYICILIVSALSHNTNQPYLEIETSFKAHHLTNFNFEIRNKSKQPISILLFEDKAGNPGNILVPPVTLKQAGRDESNIAVVRVKNTPEKIFFAVIKDMDKRAAGKLFDVANMDLYQITIPKTKTAYLSYEDTALRPQTGVGFFGGAGIGEKKTQSGLSLKKNISNAQIKVAASIFKDLISKLVNQKIISTQ